MTDYGFTAADGTEIYAAIWETEKPKGIVQILHGMAEHIERYDEFACYLNSQGYVVAGEDHRGHGKTAGNLENTGYFAELDGWNIVIKDNLKLAEKLRGEFPGIPYYIFAHSMGSFLTRKLIAEHPEGIKKVILSGSGDFDMGTLNMLGGLAKLQAGFFGKKARAKMLDKLSFSSMNNQFKPGRTGFEWLSRDEKKVDEYLADPYCGFVATIGFYLDFAYGLKYLKTGDCFEKTPKDLPILFYSGENDPVGGNGEQIKNVSEEYKKNGFTNIELELNPGGHHESLNETNRQDVYKTFADWLAK